MIKKLPPVSSQYKKEVRNAVITIIFFFLLYAVLIFLSLVFIALLGYFTFQLITTFKIGYFTVLIGAGLIGMGVFILIFLFKFLFSFKKEDTTGFIEISRSTEPKLFELIDDVVNEVQTQHPKKVFLSHDVNAFVNYNSVFWSMFFPVKKNLTVGLGLINTTTVSELKGILAHEFGHFSQKSMKVGSFVNQANKIIYDMLFNDTSYQNMLNKFAQVHGVLYFFGKLAHLFTVGVKWVLAKAYDILFLKHLSLKQRNGI